MFLLLVVFCLSAFAQKTSDDVAMLSQNIIQLYNKKNYKEAIPIAEKVSLLQRQIHGVEHIEYAKALRNLGYLYYLVKDVRKAESVLEQSISSFEKVSGLDDKSAGLVAEMAELLGRLKNRSKKVGSAEDFLLLSIRYREKRSFPDLGKIADLYRLLGDLKHASLKFQASARYYEQSFLLRYKVLGKTEEKTEDVFERCLCSLKKASKSKKIKALRTEFYPESVKAKLESQQKSANVVPLIMENVVNGRAISLPKPYYPRSARISGARGTVRVKIRIDAMGRVTFACAAFNKVHPSLMRSSEWAAYQAKFEPTTLDGKPVMVTGIIVYNYK